MQCLLYLNSVYSLSWVNIQLFCNSPRYSHLLLNLTSSNLTIFPSRVTTSVCSHEPISPFFSSKRRTTTLPVVGRLQGRSLAASCNNFIFLRSCASSDPPFGTRSWFLFLSSCLCGEGGRCTPVRGKGFISGLGERSNIRPVGLFIGDWCMSNLFNGDGSLLSGETPRFIGDKSLISGDAAWLIGDGSLIGRCASLFGGDGDWFLALKWGVGGLRWSFWMGVLVTMPIPAALRISLMTPPIEALRDGFWSTILHTAGQYGWSFKTSLILSGQTLGVYRRIRAQSSAMIFPMAQTSERWSLWLPLCSTSGAE